jgi:choline dehydrogenase-like flavoprotein
MIVDCLHLPDRGEIQGEYCIIGAGAAGITVANELLRSGADVMLLESGGRKTRRATQELNKGEVIDTDRHGALHQYRHRRFGGTTDVWGGRCAPFDPIDFEPRPYVAWSGWPIGRGDLDPYYAIAHEYCELGEYTYVAREALAAEVAGNLPGLAGSPVLSEFIWRFSLPTDFGKTFWKRFSEARNLRVYLNATALQLRTRPNGDGVDRLDVGSPGGKRFAVRARHFIVATGGIEAARLLLVSRDAGAQGLGNSRDLVGRFYISHITGDLGHVAFSLDAAALMAHYARTRDNVYCRRALSISERKQREAELLNFRAILSHPCPANPTHGSGVLSAMYLVKRFLADRIPPEYSRALSGLSPIHQYSAHFRNVLKDWRGVADFAALWGRKRVLSRRKLPSVVHKSKSNVYTLHFDAEQAPNPNSRVMLSDAIDEFGFNRLKVDWRCTDQDIDSVVKCAAIIAAALRNSGAGKCLFDPERLGSTIAQNTGVGSHYIGTTRMAGTPAAGVVDSNCKVFGLENLYIASSSVFPTSSFANPTLTIIALAIRLANHLIPYRSMRISTPEARREDIRDSRGNRETANAR